MNREFAEFLGDLFAPLGGVSMQRMFGGLGIRRDGRMFALVAGGVLYFKSDDETAAVFDGEGCDPFSYATKTGRTTITSYRRAPERLFDDPDEFLEFARMALAAAARADASKAAGKSRRKRSTKE